MAVVTILYLGSKVPPSTGDDRIRFVAEPAARLATISADRLNSKFATADAKLIGFVDAAASVPVTALQRAIEAVHAQPRLAGAILATASPVARLNRWERFPLRLASLMRPLAADTALIVRRGELHDFRDVGAPLWGWLVRAMSGGRQFAVVDADDSQQATLTTDFLPELAPRAPGPDRAWLAEHLRSVRPEDLVRAVRSHPDALAVKAGLLQLHDYLDESHSIAQSIEGEGRHRSGDYWHAIMHRREPDDSNSKYWSHQVGRHPIFLELAERASGILQRCASPEAARWQNRLAPAGQWDPLAFVDLCSQCRRGHDDALERAARQIQLSEMWLLLDQTVRDASA
jgi:hypothetical protein